MYYSDFVWPGSNAGGVGEAMLALRKDAAGTVATADGRLGPIQMDASGNVRVVVSGTIATSPGASSGTKTFSTPATQPSGTARLVLAANASRKQATIFNAGTVTTFLGKDNSVTTANGLPLLPNAAVEDLASSDAWWGITAGTTADLRVCEVA